MNLQEKRPAPRGDPDARQEAADWAELQRAAFAVFARELSALLDEQAGKWVAYHGPERLGIADNDTDLYELGRQRGLSPQAMLVIGIDAEADQVPILSEAALSAPELAEAAPET